MMKDMGYVGRRSSALGFTLPSYILDDHGLNCPASTTVVEHTKPIRLLLPFLMTKLVLTKLASSAVFTTESMGERHQR